MLTSRVIHSVSCHAEGEVGDVIVGGVSPPPGKSIWEQSRWIAEDQELRSFMLHEPRGGVFRHVNLLVPPIHPDADMGWIIMEPEDTPPMSGSNSICVSTVILETGIKPMTEPETFLVLEAPGGLVRVKAACRDQKVLSVETQNLPSFVDRRDASLEVEGYGTLLVDTAYGGDSFVILDATKMGFSIVPDEARELAKLGSRITAAANEQLGFCHPEQKEWDHLSFCMFTMPLKKEGDVFVGRNTVSIQPGKLDRSPCGTGCSARLAQLHAKGELNVGETFIGESVIGSRFYCRIEKELSLVNGHPAIVPSLRGRAWITGTHQHTLDPDDPWPQGYKISDTWPKKF